MLLPLLQSALAAPLWPIPSQHVFGAQVVWLAGNAQFICSPGSSNPNNNSIATNSSKNAISSSAVIEAATQRIKESLTGDGLVPWKYHPRNSNFEPSSYSVKTSISRVTLQNRTDPKNFYTLEITAPVIITAPLFPHRSLNMDLSRTHYPPADIKCTIGALTWNKFNHLHLHTVDAQSWSVEIPALPELAQKGAYHDRLTNSPKDLADIQEYGAYCGIDVTIEFEMPGHTAAIALAYPDLMNAYNRADYSAGNFSAERPFGQLKLGNAAVEPLAHVSQYTSYMYAGGDEVRANPYSLDPGFHHVRKAGITPMVWEAMLPDWNLKLSDDVVVQTWNGATSLPQTVAKGHKALAGDYNFWYLDCGKGQWLDFAPGTSSQSYYPDADYCSPTRNWRLRYSFDPLDNIPPSSSRVVIGGEVHILSEQIDPMNLGQHGVAARVRRRGCAVE